MLKLIVELRGDKSETIFPTAENVEKIAREKMAQKETIAVILYRAGIAVRFWAN